MEEELPAEKQQLVSMENSDEASSIDTGPASSNCSNSSGQNPLYNSSNMSASEQQNETIQSSSSLTYYYSSFDLFENSNPAFLKYRRFINKLQVYLGPDWMIYASKVVYREIPPSGAISYYTNTVVFELCLEIWLQMRRDFNRDLKNLGQMMPQTPTTQMQQQQTDDLMVMEDTNTQKLLEISFSMFEENEMFEQFSAKFSSSFPGCLMDQMTYKPVLHGFFLSAVETWNYILRNPTKKRQRSDSFKQVFDEYKKKIIKPMMVVQQKLTGIFGQAQKPKKTTPDLNENLLRSFQNFAKNMNNEEEMMVEEMKKLEISSGNTGKEFQQPQAMNQMQQQQPVQPQQQVTMKKISDIGDKAIKEYAQQYLQNIVNDTERRWQVARGFVTNIIELKYNDLQEYANSIKIRFLQPAQDFYNQLLDTYILFKSKNYTNIQFKDFLEKAKQNLGSKWSESLVIPTQVFFQTLMFQWNSILNERTDDNVDDETIIKLFVQRVRSTMAESWDENIVKKAQENIPE